MGTKQENITRVQSKNPVQREIEQMLIGSANQASGQINLGGMASGDIFQITPQMEALVNASVGGQADISRRQADQDYEEQERLLRANLAKRGQTDSSFEGISQATLGQQHYQNLANIESQRSSAGSQALLNLPFQIGQQQLGANQLLLQQLGAANPVLDAYNQTRMANSTNTQSQSGMGNTFGQFAQLGSGAFGQGGIFGSRKHG